MKSAKPGDPWVKFGDVGIKYSDLKTYRDNLVASDSKTSGPQPLVVTPAGKPFWTGGNVIGFGEGQCFIGSIASAASFTAHLAGVVPAGYVIAATATDANGNTSTFSQFCTVPAYADNGSDGTPGQWMIAHFGHADPLIGDKSRANDDADGDGMTNLQEFRAGTDPRGASSRFGISGMDRVGGNPRIGFQSISGKSYRLEYKDAAPSEIGLSVFSSGWSTLIDEIYGTGGLLQITDPSAAGVNRPFYPLVLEP